MTQLKSKTMRDRGSIRTAGLFIVILVLLIFGGAFIWKNVSGSLDVPMPNMEGMEPQVVKKILETRDELLKEPNIPGRWADFGAACQAHELFVDAELCYQRAYEFDPSDFKWTYLLGVLYFETDRENELIIDQFKKALELEPNYVAAYCRLGEMYARIGQLDEARQSYETALELAPETPAALLGLGQVYLSLDEPELAVELLMTADSLVPQDTAVYAALAQAYTRLDQSKFAEMRAQRMNQCAARIGIPDPVYSVVSAMRSSVAFSEVMGGMLYDMGDYVGAIEKWKQVLELRPNDIRALTYLGKSYVLSDQAEEARKVLLRALELDEDSSDVHVGLAMMHIELGRDGQAVNHFRLAIDYNPNNDYAMKQLAQVYGRNMNFRECILLYEQAERVAPLDATDSYFLGTALYNVGQMKHAHKRLSDSLFLNPRNANACFMVGVTLESLGKREEAVDFYMKARMIKPDHAEVNQRLQALGVTIQRMGSTPE